MAVTITKRPEQEIEGNFTSRWLSAVHPIIFELTGEAYDPVSRPNYGIQVEVYESGTETLLGRTKRIRPYPGDPVQVNVTAFLRNYLDANITEMKKGDVNKRDTGKAVEFYIRYKDAWDGEDGTYIRDGSTYFAALTKQQIGDRYGSNLAQYLPVYGDVQDENKAKFLTTFKRPVFFRGYPFSLSFIYPAVFNNVDMQTKETRFSKNGGQFSAVFRQLDKTQINGINRVQLSGNYPDDVDRLSFHIRTGQTADTDYYISGYINSGFID